MGKVTEYIAHAGQHDHRFYVVLETEEGNLIVTEQLQNGKVAWDENPTDLEDRIALSKEVRSAECKRVGITIAFMKARSAETSCKSYAQSSFNRARGDSSKHSKSGFFKRSSVSA